MAMLICASIWLYLKLRVAICNFGKIIGMETLNENSLFANIFSLMYWHFGNENLEPNLTTNNKQMNYYTLYAESATMQWKT